MSPEMDRCVRDCAECFAVCSHCAQHCLQMGGDHASPEHQGLMNDCAQLCAAAVGVMARSSAYAPDLCALCAEVCEDCAADCESMAGNDETMKKCAEVCRRCAASCNAMGSGRR